jgi:hypothetical protein
MLNLHCIWIGGYNRRDLLCYRIDLLANLYPVPILLSNAEFLEDAIQSLGPTKYGQFRRGVERSSLSK